MVLRVSRREISPTRPADDGASSVDSGVADGALGVLAPVFVDPSHQIGLSAPGAK